MFWTRRMRCHHISPHRSRRKANRYEQLREGEMTRVAGRGKASIFNDEENVLRHFPLLLLSKVGTSSDSHFIEAF